MNLSENYRMIDLESRVMNASPLELLILCYERLIDELISLKGVLGESASHRSEVMSSRVREIIQRGLIDALNFNANQEIATNLQSTYEWSLRQILLAEALRDENRLDAVIDVYKILLDAWEEVRARGHADSAAA